jgi:hypothetical protein
MKPKVKSNKQSNKPYILDKLEVTLESSLSKSATTLYNTALSRYNTVKKVNRIIQDIPTKEVFDKYQGALNCSKVVLQEGSKLNMMRCKKKFCQTCSRIKTADMINGYYEALMSLGQLYFVTLTAPTVKGRQLKSEINKRLKAFQRVKDRLRKRGIKLNGMRKLECTFTEEGKYHPHFHFIQLGAMESKALLEEWLKEFPKASIKAQDITPVINITSFKELFKYGAKETVKNVDIPGEALHTIYKAFEGVRNFQAYGKVKKAKYKPQAEELTTDFMPIKDQYQYEVYLYQMKDKTWTSAEGEYLINTNEITFNLLQDKINQSKIEQNRYDE